MMTFKKMAELYAYYEFQSETWDMLYQMVCHGLIKRDVWEKFFNKFKSIQLDDDNENAIDAETGEVVYRREPETRTFKI